jgi:hypothetical protein
MQRTIRFAVITGAAVLAIAQPVGALAGHSPTFMPPPGCTGGWNTFQSAFHNHAPGTSPGCLKHIEFPKR